MYELEEDAAGENLEATDDRGKEKLKLAKAKFQASVDHDADSKAEAHRALRFYANSELTGQWESEDLAYLVDQGRPAFSFNIVASKVDTFLGFYADAQRKPVVAATGEEDQLLAEVLNICVDQMLDKANYERLAARQLKTGTVAGECGIHIEVEPSPLGKGWVQVNLYRILPFEMHWDSSSIEPDRSDARCVFWDRWLEEEEFNEAYPENADDYKSASSAGDPWGSDPESDLWGEDGSDTRREDDYNSRDMSRYYFDRHEDKIRVVRYEYKTFVTKYTLTDAMSGQEQEIEEGQVEQVQQAIAMGHPMELSEDKVEVVKVMEFVGTNILAEYDTAGPFDGFSIVSYAYSMDEETGTAHGLVRNLFDPQMELNKSKSLEIETIAQSVTTGTVAEKSAIVDQAQYEDAIRQPGATAYVEDNALMEGRVRDRVLTPPNAAVLQRAAGAVDLLNEISGMPSQANISPGEAAQAGIAVAIRYNKARQSVSQPFGNFEDSQKGVTERIVQIITRAMPDDQIESLLSADGRFMVGQGQVVEMGPDPSGSGQQVPQSRAAIRDIRSLTNDIEFEHGTENSTLRMLEFESLERLQASGVAVDPEVLVELATTSRSMQERLKTYVEESAASAQQQQQAESESMQQAQANADALQREQIQAIVDTEIAKVVQKAQDSERKASLDAAKQSTDTAQGWAELWERADADEKDRMLQWAKLNDARLGAAMGAQR